MGQIWGDTDYCGTCAPQPLPSMALNAAFRECGLRLGIDCLRFCFPPRAVNHRSPVVGARKVPREAEVIIPGCMCPPIQWITGRDKIIICPSMCPVSTHPIHPYVHLSIAMENRTRQEGLSDHRRPSKTIGDHIMTIDYEHKKP